MKRELGSQKGSEKRGRPAVKEIPWHSMEAESVLQDLGVDAETGLGQNEIERRLERYGFNELERSEGSSPLVLLACR